MALLLLLGVQLLRRQWTRYWMIQCVVVVVTFVMSLFLGYDVSRSSERNGNVEIWIQD